MKLVYAVPVYCVFFSWCLYLKKIKFSNISFHNKSNYIFVSRLAELLKVLRLKNFGLKDANLLHSHLSYFESYFRKIILYRKVILQKHVNELMVLFRGRQLTRRSYGHFPAFLCF